MQGCCLMHVCDNRERLLMMMHVNLMMIIIPVMMIIRVEWHLHVMCQGVLLVYHQQIVLQVVVPPLSVASHAAEDDQDGEDDPPDNHLGNSSRSRIIDSTFAVDADTCLAA